MKIGFTEFLLIIVIISIAIGPGIARFLDRWTHQAKKTYKKASKQRAVAAVQRRAEREIILQRLQRFGILLLIGIIAVLAWSLTLRPIKAEPQVYEAAPIRDAASQQVNNASTFAVDGYKNITRVRTHGQHTYFAAQTTDGDDDTSVLVRMNTSDTNAVVVVTADGEITDFDFDEDGDIWFTVVTTKGGALCRAEYDGWGAATEQVVTQINGVGLHCPTSVTIADDGKIYFADAANVSTKHGLESALRTELMAHTATGCVYVYDPETLSVQCVINGIAGAASIALSPDNATLYVADLGSRCVWAAASDSRDILAGGKECSTFAAQLPAYPGALAVDTDGTVYISYLWSISTWLETQTGSTFWRGVALRAPQWAQKKLFSFKAKEAAAEAISASGEPQAALYISSSNASQGGFTGREPGVFWAYRTN